MYFSFLKSPNPPVYLKPVKADLNKSVVKVAVMQENKVCQDNFMFQKDETSSMANKRPPTGAPKAEATPAPAPADMKLRLIVNKQKISQSEAYRVVEKKKTFPKERQFKVEKKNRTDEPMEEDVIGIK